MLALPSKLTPLIVLAVASVVAVVALPVRSPVTLPVRFPTKDEAANALFALSLELPLSHVIVGLELLAPNSMPAPFVLARLVAPLATLIVASSTSNVAVFSVTVSPLTVRSPVTVRSLPMVTSSGRAKVIALLLTVVVISLDVPVNVSVSPVLNVSLEPLSAASVKLVAILFVVTAVTRPLAFTVMAGMAVALPKEPTLEFTVSRVVVIVVLPRLVMVALPSTSPSIVIVGSLTLKSKVPSPSS